MKKYWNQGLTVFAAVGTIIAWFQRRIGVDISTPALFWSFQLFCILVIIIGMCYRYWHWNEKARIEKERLLRDVIMIFCMYMIAWTKGEWSWLFILALGILNLFILRRNTTDRAVEEKAIGMNLYLSGTITSFAGGVALAMWHQLRTAFDLSMPAVFWGMHAFFLLMIILMLSYTYRNWDENGQISKQSLLRSIFVILASYMMAWTRWDWSWLPILGIGILDFAAIKRYAPQRM